MAGVSGKQGTINWAAGNVAGFDNWSLDNNVNLLDITTFSTGTLQWEVKTPGLSGVTGTISGNFDGASTGLDNLITATITPATGTLILEADKTGGGKWSIPAYLSNMNASVAIDGKSEISFNFTGTGAVTYTTTT
jgi:hypothetical protein